MRPATRRWRRPRPGPGSKPGPRRSPRLTTAEQAHRKSTSNLDTAQAELAAAQRRVERAEAEAALARQLLAELRVAPREREGGGGRRGKAGGPAPTEKQAQSEEQGKEQGAPAASLNPDDGNDGNEGK